MQHHLRFVRPTRSRNHLVVLALLATACSSPSAPPAVATVSVAPGSPSIIAGLTQQLSATTTDASGKALTGRAIAWSSGAPAVATVSAAGMVTGVAPGSVAISATSEGRTGTATVTVLPVPVASVRVTPATATVAAGATAQFVADPLDANGGVLTGRLMTWSSSNPVVAAVNASGLASTLSGGSATISATAEGRTGTSVLTVQASAAPVIVSIQPSPMIPGSAATISGIGFGSGENVSITIGGAPAPLVGGGPGQFAVLVPCVRGGDAIVRVTVAGASGQRTHPVSTPVRTLAVGQSFITTDASSSSCTELTSTAGSSRYLVAVFSNATSANTLIDVALSGNPAVSGMSALRVPSADRVIDQRDTPRDADFIRDSAHFQFLERDRALYARLMATTPPASLRASQATTPLPSLGAMRNAFFTFTGGCNDTTRVVRGKAIYVGSRAIIWEDSTNSPQSADNPELAGYYQRLGMIFDQDQYDAVRRTFGDPLRRDPVTDNDGRIHMVFTQRLAASGTVAYVTSCDQFPNSPSARGSNFGEYFYSTVPTTSTSNFNSTASPDGWFYFMARTVVHEVKHVASHAARVANGAPAYEQSWLEEGTARHAEEVWVRPSMHRVAWKGNTGFGTAATGGIYCDFHPTDQVCNAADLLRRPGYGMRRQFNENREKLLEPWNWSPFGTGSGQSGSGFYQVSWSLVRYTIDRYGASDETFLTALNNGLTNGVTNLTVVAGAPLDRLLGGWGLALFADDYPGLVAPPADIQFPTWNMRHIYAGLNAAPAWTARWSSPFPIAPTQLGFGAFTSAITGLRGGSHSYFEITGTMPGSQLLSLRAPSGGEASPDIRIAVVRLP